MSFQILRWIDFAARITIVGKSGVRPDKDFIFKPKAVPQLDAALDRHFVADYDITFDENVVTDITVASDDSADKDVCERPNSRARTDI